MEALVSRELSEAPRVMVALDKLHLQVRKADLTFDQLEDIVGLASAAQRRFKPVKDVSDKAGEIWCDAEERLGIELSKLPAAIGTRGQLRGVKPGKRGRRGTIAGGAVVELPANRGPSLAELKISRKRAARAKHLARLTPSQRKDYLDELKAEEKAVTPYALLQKHRTHLKQTAKHEVAQARFSETGPFDVVVIDPPWPMQKIDRDERPNQDSFDYPVMTEEQLATFWSETVAPRQAKNCHVFCWTTQKFLRMTLRLVETWKLRQVLVMVWHKSGGFQPHDLPQYNCEFVVYARKGTPVFLDTKDFKCCFEAPRREHSRKPEFFYDLVRRITGGSRIDIFSREKRKGFAQYGNETEKFNSPG